MSIDDLRKIARLRGIKELAKEDLIHTLLRSGKNLLEDIILNILAIMLMMK